MNIKPLSSCFCYFKNSFPKNDFPFWAVFQNFHCILNGKGSRPIKSDGKWGLRGFLSSWWGVMFKHVSLSPSFPGGVCWERKRGSVVVICHWFCFLYCLLPVNVIPDHDISWRDPIHLLTSLVMDPKDQNDFFSPLATTEGGNRGNLQLMTFAEN